MIKKCSSMRLMGNTFKGRMYINDNNWGHASTGEANRESLNTDRPKLACLVVPHARHTETCGRKDAGRICDEQTLGGCQQYGVLLAKRSLYQQALFNQNTVHCVVIC